MAPHLVRQWNQQKFRLLGLIGLKLLREVSMAIIIDSISDAAVLRIAAGLVAAGDSAAAFQLLKSLSERQTREAGPAHPALGRTLGEMALIAFAQGKNSDAEALTENALKILR